MAVFIAVKVKELRSGRPHPARRIYLQCHDQDQRWREYLPLFLNRDPVHNRAVYEKAKVIAEERRRDYRRYAEQSR